MNWYQHLFQALFDNSWLVAWSYLIWPIGALISGRRATALNLADEVNLIDSVIAWTFFTSIIASLAVIVLLAGKAAGYFVGPLVMKVPFVPDLVRHSSDVLRSIYAWFDRSLYPATGYILYAAFFWALILLMDHVLRRSQKQPSSQLIGTILPLIMILIVGFLAGFALIVAGEGVLRNPATILIYLGFLTGFLSMLPRMNSLANKYEPKGVIKNRKFSLQPSSKNLDHGYFHAFLAFTVLLAFWYNLTIGQNIAITFFAASIGGLLAIIGFAALVYTFSFQTISKMKYRRLISSDTKAFQFSSVIVIISSLFGLVLVDGDIYLDANAPFLRDALLAGLFVCSFCGLINAALSVMLLFKHVSEVLEQGGRDSASASIYIYEGHSSGDFSALNMEKTGLSSFREMLEDQNVNVEAIEKLNTSDFIEPYRQIIVLPRFNQDFPEKSANALQDIVGAGVILLVLCESTDLPFKKNLLLSFGFPVPAVMKDYGNVYIPRADDPARREIVARAKQHIVFPGSTGSMPLMQTDVFDAEDGTRYEDIVVARKFGAGFVVVAGAHGIFENAELATRARARHVECLLKAMLSLFPEPMPTPCFADC